MINDSNMWTRSTTLLTRVHQWFQRSNRASCMLQIQGLLTCSFLLAVQFVYAQDKTRPLEDYFREAREYETRKDYPGAGRIYQEAAASYPRQPEVLKRLGLIYQTELKFPESIEIFQKVLQEAPQYPEANFYLGLSFLGLNQFEKAIEAFNKELESNPKYRRAHYYTAEAYIALNRS